MSSDLKIALIGCGKAEAIRRVLDCHPDIIVTDTFPKQSLIEEEYKLVNHIFPLNRKQRRARK